MFTDQKDEAHKDVGSMEAMIEQNDYDYNMVDKQTI